MTESPVHISVISPVYQAQDNVHELVHRISASVKSITPSYEIVLVEDGSTDRSWEEISHICRKDEKVKGIKLSRNFGQHYAITAGLEYGKGNYMVVLDCDLQHDPSYIKEMLAKAQEGYDVIFTELIERKHAFFKNLSAKLFFAVFNWLTYGVKASSTSSSFTLLSRKAVNSFKRVKDYHRHYLMVLNWIGHRSYTLKIEHKDRYKGRSSYSFKRLVNHAIDGIVSQSDKLLRISIFIGLIYFLFSIASSIVLVALYFMQGFKEGWASTIVILLLSTGVILMSLGITGLYLAKVFEQSKNRPLYLVDEELNLHHA